MRSHSLGYRLLVTTAAGCLLCVALVGFGLHYYDHPGPLSEPKTLLFKRGTGFQQIVDTMEGEGVIRHGWMFKALAVAHGDARKFKSGEYKFSAFITPRLIMDMIAEGRVVVHKIKVPEGFTVAQVKKLLEGEELLEGEITGNISEGSLLPQTYHYTYGDQRQDMIKRMQAGMTQTLDELWPKRKEGLPIETQEQALVLASIVEKETGVARERGLVASVFINRLNKGMKLQSDPTVIYGIERENGPLGRTLLGSDLGYDSPYNTYKREGLPPAAIANPGREALEAVLNPPESNYFYFVATGSGGHNFSANLAGHNDNVREYRKVIGKKNKPEEPPPPVPPKASEPEKKKSKK